MAKISNYRRISSSDYTGEAAQTVDQLSQSLNPFMREVTDAINGGLDFDNLSQNIIEFEITVDDSGNPQTKQVNFGKINAIGTEVINARNVTNPSIYPTSKPFISFTRTGSNVVTVNNISGLPANQKFLLTVIVY